MGVKKKCWWGLKKWGSKKNSARGKGTGGRGVWVGVKKRGEGQRPPTGPKGPPKSTTGARELAGWRPANFSSL